MKQIGLIVIYFKTRFWQLKTILHHIQSIPRNEAIYIEEKMEKSNGRDT